MTTTKNEKSEIERVREKQSVLRCVNCFERMKIQSATKRIICPSCGVEYMIGWRGKKKRQAKILGTPIPGKHI